MIFASNNKGKLKQIKDLCKGKVQVFGLEESGINIDVEENGNSFEENAVKKASAIFTLTKKPVLADDSGLSIDFFDGWPGVYTHRFLPKSTPEERNDFIIEKMQNVSEELRGAKHVCVLAYIDGQGQAHVFEGIVNGKIVHKQRGNNYFGFDPIFEIDNGKTLAELTDEEKIKVNARSKAFQKFLDFLQNSKKTYWQKRGLVITYIYLFRVR